MYLFYDNKKPEKEVRKSTEAVALRTAEVHGESHGNSQLLQGDNIRIMKTLLEEGVKVDLVYIDPPFARNTTFRTSKERTATVSSSRSDEIAYHDKRTGEEFLEFLRERLILLRELLTLTGSIYVHIDDKIGHYVKILMDEVFGRQNFRNDISRIKSNPKNFSRLAYGNIKDVILFYTKSEKSTWNEPKRDAPEESIVRLFPKTDKVGRHYTTNPLHAPGETKDGRSGKPWKGILPPRGRHWRYSQAVLDQLERWAN